MDASKDTLVSIFRGSLNFASSGKLNKPLPFLDGLVFAKGSTQGNLFSSDGTEGFVGDAVILGGVLKRKLVLALGAL